LRCGLALGDEPWSRTKLNRRASGLLGWWRQ
jgi:hypothetical protein